MGERDRVSKRPPLRVEGVGGGVYLSARGSATRPFGSVVHLLLLHPTVIAVPPIGAVEKVEAKRKVLEGRVSEYFTRAEQLKEMLSPAPTPPAGGTMEADRGASGPAGAGADDPEKAKMRGALAGEGGVRVVVRRRRVMAGARVHPLPRETRGVSSPSALRRALAQRNSCHDTGSGSRLRCAVDHRRCDCDGEAEREVGGRRRTGGREGPVEGGGDSTVSVSAAVHRCVLVTSTSAPTVRWN